MKKKKDSHDFISLNRPTNFPLVLTSGFDADDTNNEFKGNPLSLEDGVVCLQIMKRVFFVCFCFFCLFAFS